MSITDIAFVLFSSLTTYHAVYYSADELRYQRLFIKAIPCLIGFYQIQQAKRRTNCKPGAPTTVQCGMVLSAIGDLFLIYGDIPRLFIPGVIFFGLAQVMYTMSFGWEKIQPYTFMMTSSLVYGLQKIIMDDIEDEQMKVIVTAYSVLIGFMVWRSLDGAFVDDASFPERLFALGAGIFFVVSDLCLGINMFVTPIPHSKLIVLSTYFTAQYCFVKWAICKAERATVETFDKNK